jgi:hypothetical protein
MSANDDSRIVIYNYLVMLQIVASLTNNSRVTMEEDILDTNAENNSLKLPQMSN